ncbi:MAG TPA: DNA recombination protein RmuC [Acetobacteraceae bacterium]|nr:DNA recombination protein RmuC [Acetobacteraceae bacterium]
MAVLILAALAAACAVLAAAAALAAWRGQAGLAGAMERARLAAEQARDAASGQAETTRRMIEAQGRDMVERVTALRGAQDMAMEQLRTVLSREQGELRLALGEAREAIGRAIGTQFDTTRAVLDEKLRELREGNETKLAEMQALLAEQTRRAGEQSEAARTLLDARLKELREGNEAKLAEIQKTVNEQLHAAVEKQMTESFARVIDQFAAVQKALGEFSVLSSQMGDIKRLFSNVKTRGGWGEAQVRAMLDDILPVDAYETSCRVKPDSDEAVEFAVRMPGRGPDRPLLAIDAKFPVEAYERLLSAADAGDAEAERAASRQLETAVRLQARKIAEKYINPPITVDYAVMYLPTDGLFAEIARTPGLIDSLGRDYHVVVLGPSLFPALLRTIHLGVITLAIEQKAEQVRKLLGATASEMGKMDQVLERLAKNAGTMTNTIEAARTRTRAVRRVLRGVEAIAPEAADELLELAAEEAPAEEA